MRSRSLWNIIPEEQEPSEPVGPVVVSALIFNVSLTRNFILLKVLFNEHGYSGRSFCVQKGKETLILEESLGKKLSSWRITLWCGQWKCTL